MSITSFGSKLHRGTAFTGPSVGQRATAHQHRDHGIVVRTQIAGLLKNVFTHMLRNSMDHGLETAQERQAAGKNPAGHIQLGVAVALAREGGDVQVRFVGAENASGVRPFELVIDLPAKFAVAPRTAIA